MYHYAVVSVHRVIDGDTIDAVLSLGFGLSATIRVRVAGINTPELSGPDSDAGQAARLFTQAWFEGRQRIVVRTFKGAQSALGLGDGAFGRWLGDFYDDESGEHLGNALDAAGHRSRSVPDR